MQKCKSCPINCAFSRSLIRPHISAKLEKMPICEFTEFEFSECEFSKTDGFTDSVKLVFLMNSIERTN